ncbi:MAG: hypothetical protein HS100_19085 [Anaerolineales bacterium]|nr:hypothetical protein [Anaerolineales bacterium]
MQIKTKLKQNCWRRKDKPILETYKNEPELLPTKKTKPKEKAENLKTCLLKIGLKVFLEETPPLKRWFCSCLPNGSR